MLRHVRRLSIYLRKMMRQNTWLGSYEYNVGMKIRYEMLLALLGDKTFDTVLDLGCGPQYLREIIPPNVFYTGVDLYSHKPDTLVCDFNKKQFPDIEVDVIVLSGVCEYIYDMDWFVERVTSQARRYILCSYNFSEDTEKRNPIWVNAFSFDEWCSFFLKNQYQLTSKQTSNEKFLCSTTCMLFERQTGDSAIVL